MRRSPLLRSLTFGMATLAITACDALLTEPAPATPDLAVSFSFEGATAGGVVEAFDRVDRVFLRFTRADSVQRDTVVPLSNRNGEARAKLVLDPKERINALGVYAELRAGQAALFQGAKVVRVESGTATSAEISLTPIPAEVRADRAQVTLQMVGDTTRLASAVLFASGDTIPGIAGTWASEDASIIAVTPAGLAIGRQVGQTRLQVRYGTFVQTLDARVLSNR